MLASTLLHQSALSLAQALAWSHDHRLVSAVFLYYSPTPLCPWAPNFYTFHQGAKTVLWHTVQDTFNVSSSLIYLSFHKHIVCSTHQQKNHIGSVDSIILLQHTYWNEDSFLLSGTLPHLANIEKARLVLHLYLDLLSILLGTPDLLKPAKCGLPLCHSVLHILDFFSLINDYFTWIKKSLTSFTSSSSLNLTLSPLPLKLNLRISIIFLLIHKPILLAVSSSLMAFLHICFLIQEMRAISSVKSTSSGYSIIFKLRPVLVLSVICCMTQSIVD